MRAKNLGGGRSVRAARTPQPASPLPTCLVDNTPCYITLIDEQQFGTTKQEVSGSNLVTSTQAENTGTYFLMIYILLYILTVKFNQRQD